MSGVPRARILIVEDQKLIAADLENTLRKLEYEVLAAVSSGEKAIATTEELRPDLVLMDIRLRGEMDGIEAAAIIRQRVDVPVIYLTAYADEQTLRRAKITTPFGYVVKPFNERELRAAIEIALYKHQTDSQLAEERARRRAAEEFKRLVETVRDYAIFMLDPDGRITSWNAGAERIKGYRHDEIIGRHFSIFYQPEVAATTAQETLERAVQEGRVEDEGWRLRKDGTRFWANVVITALYDSDGRLTGFAKITRDMTDRRDMEEALRLGREEAERLNRVKDEFLATVSHELRTPLNVIAGQIWMLRTGRLPPESTQRALDLLDRNAQLQARLIDDLLDTSAMITGKLKIESGPVDVGPTLEAAVGTIRAAAAAKDIELRVDVGSGGELISGDRDRLQQIFWNLLSNAVKFTPSGGRVDVQLQRVGIHVEVRVTDTGIGLSPEFIPRLFQRFSQADTSSTRAHMGFGLGLALARHLVEAQGGELEARSAGPGLGSTFTVRFRVPAVIEIPAVAATTSLRLDGIRVLLVDDQPDARQSVSAILRMFGAVVASAASVAEAMAALEATRPNVLLADIGMPEQDGYDLIAKIRGASEPELRTVAAAALTAYSTPEDRLRVLSAGYHLHMAKPMNPVELAAAVARLAKDVSAAAQGATTKDP